MTDSTWQSCEAREDLYQGKTTCGREVLIIIFKSYLSSYLQQLSDGGTRAVHGAEHGGPGGAGDQGWGPGGGDAGGSDGGAGGTQDK